MKNFLVIIAVCLTASVTAHSQQIASTDPVEVCAIKDGVSYSRAHRSHRKGRQGYEHDHIVPLCLGGADTEKNLQWEVIGESKEKDKLERLACRAVCSHRIPLSEAQGWFLTDWRLSRVLLNR